jgi:signal transduction histidine kinase/DNA-binding NarL/FixJ family response regulator
VPTLASLVRRKRMEAMAYGVLFILFSVPFIISHHSLYTRYARQLRQMNRELMTHRDHLERMVQLRTSELMTAKDRAEEAEKAKGQFLAVMSHEIRTPLNTILGMCEVLSASGLAPYQKRRLSSITEAGSHLVELINDILDITRLDSLQTELELRPFMLPALLESAAQVARSSTREASRGLRFDIDIPPGIEACRLGDPTRLKQVLVNLLSNAFKFTREGRVTLGVNERGGDDLLFIVRDTGIGIPTGRLRHIFDEYTQVDASTSREFGGTGLGLAICRRLAKIMNGALWAESTEGEGSTFFFRVPLPVTEPEAPAELGVPSLAGGTEGAAAVPAVRVLVAEDMAANYEIVRLFMEPTPAEPERAANGLQAVDMALTGRYAMVLMDLQMPEMDGIDAVAALRGRERELGLERTPVVALTANVLPSRRRQALDAGCDEVLTKPLLSAALYRAIIHYARVTPDTALAEPAVHEPPRQEPGADGPLGVLVDELDEETEAMARMLDKGDLAYVARVAHGLKGAARSYGLEPLARALAALEAAAEAGDAQATREALGPLAEARAALN